LKLCLKVLLALGWTLASSFIQAHELRPAVADISNAAPDQLTIELRVNLEALIADLGIEHDDSDDSPKAAIYDELRALDAPSLNTRLETFLPDFYRGLNLQTRDLQTGMNQRLDVVLSGVDIPAAGDTEVARDSTMTLDAVMSPGARSFTWNWDDRFGPIIVRSADADRQDAFSVYLLPGDTSAALPIAGLSDDSPTNDNSDGPVQLDPSAGNVADSSIAAGSAGGTTVAATFFNYVRVGFVHILPLGLDHILFVIGLFLLSPRARPLLWQVTVFTLAHSVTLALGALDLVSVPATIVEPLIALSIVAICLENLVTNRLHRWRLMVVFAFGLLHGLGFASVLGSINGDAKYFVVSLLAFNVGVEIGQITVLLLCFALIGWWARDRHWYRAVVSIPLSVLIGAIGLYWFVERLSA